MIDEFVYKLKYARYNKEAQRREEWPESVKRYIEMHRNRFPYESDHGLIDPIEKAILNKEILPSMRGLQFGGAGIERKNMRMYNCTSSHCDRPRFFAEALWLLLCGSGVGFSVQKHHVAQLPQIREPKETMVYIVPDSIEGWADAVNMLISAFMLNVCYPIFDYSQIRPEGAPLTVGGKAPGHLPLKQALENIEPILRGAIGRQLKPIEAFDIVMHLANCTVTAGTRRSATIALFSLDDDEMMNAKTGNWFEEHSHRARANISAVVLPSAQEQDFKRLFESTRQFGEPAFLFLESTEHCVNPCVEIVMCPLLIKDAEGYIVDDYTLDLINPANRTLYEDQGYTFESGWQVCNLTSINVSKAKSKGDLVRLAGLAAQLGTYQADYTDSGYLGEVSREIIEREALLGVSLCGVLSNPNIALDKETLETAALTARERNKATAFRIGINPAARITCVKPEGTASLVLNTSSGIHPNHAKKYLRRVQTTTGEEVFNHFRETNPQAVEKSVWGNGYCVVFPMEAEGLTKADLTAIELLETTALIKRHWIDPTTDKRSLEGASHNVSLTVTVEPSEWEAVADYLWMNREKYTGVSLLSVTGDYDYPQAPLVAVSENGQTDQEKEAWQLWQSLKNTMKNVDYSTMIETVDNTSPLEAQACAGGACELK